MVNEKIKDFQDILQHIILLKMSFIIYSSTYRKEFFANSMQ
jgi:hypothetical protein